jgi:hypothetical protein
MRRMPFVRETPWKITPVFSRCVVGVRAMVRLRRRGEEAGHEKARREKTNRREDEGKAGCGGAFHHAANRRALRQHSGNPGLVRSKQLK